MIFPQMKHPTPSEFYGKMIMGEELTMLGRDLYEAYTPSAVVVKLRDAILQKDYPEHTTLAELIDAVEYGLQWAYHHIDDIMATVPYDLITTPSVDNAVVDGTYRWEMGGVGGALKIDALNISTPDSLSAWEHAEPDDWMLQLHVDWYWRAEDANPPEQFPPAAELHDLFRADVEAWLNSDQEGAKIAMGIL